MSGLKSRNKGARGEREFCDILTQALGEKVTRQLGQARDGGSDVVLQPFRFEVKRQERLAINDWIAQAEAGTPPGEIPVVAFRRNNQPWRVIITLGEFIRLAREEML
jgi:hypothetical protein